MNNLTPVVSVSEGRLKGSIKCDIHNENFYSFQGIPYAKPPLGTLRFKVSYVCLFTKESPRVHCTNFRFRH